MKIKGRAFTGRGALAALALGFAACGGDEDTDVTTREAQLAEGCLLNTDCESPLVCAFRKCHVQCASTRDCDAGLLCVASDKPFFVCQLPSETKCAYNSQCAGSQVCGVDGKCREQCATEKDCLPGQRCAQATCAEAPELTDGRLPVASSAGGSGGAPAGGACVYSRDCPSPLVCRGGQCMAECLDDGDCISPRVCRESRCALPPPPDGTPPPKGWGSGCNVNSDCLSPLVCGKSGLCVFECNTPIDCASACCVDHACAPAAACGAGGGASGGSGGASGGSGGAPGGSGGSSGGAAGAGGTSGGPCDLDGDSHLATGACGGDDCDDSNAKVYPGAKERCDGVDNNCEGTVDEGAWETTGARTLFANPLSHSLWYQAPPAVAVVPGSPPRVFVATSGAELRLLELGPDLTPKGTPVKFEHASIYTGRPALATNGTSLAVAVPAYSGASVLLAATFAVDGAPPTLPVITAAGPWHDTRPRLLWNGTRYVLLWTDPHDGAWRLYRSTALPDKAFIVPTPLYADPSKVADTYSWIPSFAASVGPSSLAVVSLVNSKTALVTTDLDGASVSTPNVADLGGPAMWPSGLVRVAGDWLALGVGSSSTPPLVMQLDATTGALRAQRSLPATSGASWPFGEAVPLSDGAMMAWSAGNSVKISIVPRDLGTRGETEPDKFAPLPVIELQRGTSVSPPTVTRIDDTRIAVIWQDTDVVGAVLECVAP